MKNFKINSSVLVLVATYNGNKYVIDQLDSIRKQNFSSFNVVIRDDCSTDDTPKLIQNYIFEHNLQKKWNFGINRSNEGWRQNFINMLKEANADFIFFADQDDIWKSNKIYEMVKTAEEFPSAMVIASDYHFFDSNNKISFPQRIPEIRVTKNVFKVKRQLSNFFIQRDGCSLMVRGAFKKNIISFYDKVNISYDGLPQAHDLATWIVAILDGSLYHLKIDLMAHRDHLDSTWKKEERKVKQKKMSKIQIHENFLLFFVTIKKYYLFEFKRNSNPKIIKILSNKISDLKVDLFILKGNKRFLIFFLFFKYSNPVSWLKSIYRFFIL